MALVAPKPPKKTANAQANAIGPQVDRQGNAAIEQARPSHHHHQAIITAMRSAGGPGTVIARRNPAKVRSPLSERIGTILT
jgi:hypothetical protein